MSQIKEQKFFVKGTHCASCEILIEKKLLEQKNIKSVEVSNQKGEALIEYEGEKPSLKFLNNLFLQENYKFSEKESQTESKNKTYNTIMALSIGVLVIFGFLILNKTGLSSWVNVSKTSSLPAFFLFGVLAGLSTCAALVGGLVLSMSKQWAQVYADKNTAMQKATPHLMFNVGRLVSYALLGGALGVIGSKISISLSFSAILVMAVSVLMLMLSLQMLGVRAFSRFQIAAPKFLTRYVANEKNFKGKYMPFAMGALTFFLPCGFTITAQGLALISGGFWQGSLIMLAFAAGTLPVLLVIGLFSAKLVSNAKLSERFLKVAGVVVLFFALFNINNQMNVLGYSNFSNLLVGKTQTKNVPGQKNLEGLVPMENGKQVMKMNASASGGYAPNYFKLRVGAPVVWQITDTGTNGCTNTIVSRSLFPDDVKLIPGQITTKEFTPQKVGKFKFSCWMGMVSGVIEVVDPQSPSINASNNGNVAAAQDNDIAPSGAKGCGCGSK